MKYVVMAWIIGTLTILGIITWQKTRPIIPVSDILFAWGDLPFCEMVLDENNGVKAIYNFGKLVAWQPDPAKRPTWVKGENMKLDGKGACLEMGFIDRILTKEEKARVEKEIMETWIKEKP